MFSIWRIRSPRRPRALSGGRGRPRGLPFNNALVAPIATYAVVDRLRVVAEADDWPAADRTDLHRRLGACSVKRGRARGPSRLVPKAQIRQGADLDGSRLIDHFDGISADGLERLITLRGEGTAAGDIISIFAKSVTAITGSG
jgi:hypothetical protein